VLTFAKEREDAVGERFVKSRDIKERYGKKLLTRSKAI
jgi:hypothetical protein